jgi:DNA-binding response OmpR family regulator
MPPIARILYVEDNSDTRELVSFVLREDGFDVITVADPDEAIRLAQSERFNLYILDNWLADKSGIELCARLREFDSATPILFFSGAARERDKQQAFECGAQGYLIKPASPDVLTHEIRKLIGENGGLKSATQI